MSEELDSCKLHYERILNYVMSQYKLKNYILSYKDFLAGYSLFELGRGMGYAYPASALTNLLKTVQVDTDIDEEKANVVEINAQLQNESEELKSIR